jgi:hypothetical protein
MVLQSGGDRVPVIDSKGIVSTVLVMSTVRTT